MNYITLKTIRGYTRVPEDQISFFLYEGRKVFMVMRNGGKSRIFQSFGDLQKMLGDEFFRIHNNCIINLDQELCFCCYSRTLKVLPDHELKVAKSKLAELKKSLLKI